MHPFSIPIVDPSYIEANLLNWLLKLLGLELEEARDLDNPSWLVDKYKIIIL